MEFVDLEATENSKQTLAMIDGDTRKKAPEVLELPDAKISLGIKDHDKIVARLVGEVFFNSFHIGLLATDEQSRNHGYGGRLLEKALEVAKEKGAHFVTLETMSFNAPDFYQRHGFQVMKEVKDSPVQGTSHFFMFKDLRE